MSLSRQTSSVGWLPAHCRPKGGGGARTVIIVHTWGLLSQVRRLILFRQEKVRVNLYSLRETQMANREKVSEWVEARPNKEGKKPECYFPERKRNRD